MRGLRIAEDTMRDVQQGDCAAGINAVCTGVDTGAIADKRTAGDAKNAIRSATEQNAVFVVEEAAVLHRQVASSAPDACPVVVGHVGVGEGDAANGDVGALGDEDAL